MAKKSIKNKLPVAKPLSDGPVMASAPYKQTKEQQDRERRYKAEDGLRALQRADEVKADKTLMKDIKSLAKEQKAKLEKLC